MSNIYHTMLINSIKTYCESTIKTNQNIIDSDFKDYDGRYFDEEREQYTILETEIQECKTILNIIKKSEVA